MSSGVLQGKERHAPTDSAGIDFDCSGHECRRTFAVAIDVLPEALIAGVHLIQAREDFLCTGVEIGGDICLFRPDCNDLHGITAVLLRPV